MENNTENVKTPVTEAELAEWQELCDAVRDQKTPHWQADRDRLATFAAPALIAEVRRLQINYDRLESILSGLTYHITDGKLSNIYTLETLRAEYDDAHTKSVNECVDEAMTEIRAELVAANARAEAAEAENTRLKAGIVGAVLAERERQKSIEGWTPEHDDQHDSCELAWAACYYAMPHPLRHKCHCGTSSFTTPDSLYAKTGWDEQWAKIICLMASAPVLLLAWYAVKENHPVLAFFLAYLACELVYHAAGMVKHFHTGGAL